MFCTIIYYIYGYVSIIRWFIKYIINKNLMAYINLLKIFIIRFFITIKMEKDID